MLSAYAAPQPSSRTAAATFAGIALAYLGSVTFHVLARTGLECFPYYDLGIYAEGAYHWSLADPNPWLSGRYIKLFCDHFDPVVVLMAPFVRALPVPFGTIFFEALALLSCLLPLMWLFVRGALTLSGASLLAMLMLFHPGSVTAANYPIHPTTWALAPWVWMVAALELQRYGVAVVAFVLLMACKEEFPFVALMLAPLLWRRGVRAHAVTTLALAGMWLGFVYGLRPVLLGPVEGYAAVPFAGLLKNPWAYLVERVTQAGLYERLPLLLVPFLPLGAWLAWTARTALRLSYLALATPTEALRVLSQQWFHQYHAVTAAALGMSFVPALRRRTVPTGVFVLSAAVLVAVNIKVVRNTLNLFVPSLVTSKYDAWCPNEPGRLASLRAGRRLVRARAGSRMLIGMNLLPRLVNLRHTFAPRGPPAEQPNSYDVVFFEKPPHGMDWPIERDDIAASIDAWRAQPDTHILLDDAYAFVAEGQFVLLVPSEAQDANDKL